MLGCRSDDFFLFPTRFHISRKVEWMNVSLPFLGFNKLLISRLYLNSRSKYKKK